MTIATKALEGAVLFQDDFNGDTLDLTKWSVNIRPIGGPLGRTQTFFEPELSDGIARFRFDTYNPESPGALFRGSEILTLNEFRLVDALVFEARLRFNTPFSEGLVAAFFSFGRDDVTLGFDEIDVEILGNLIDDQRLLVNIFDNADLPLDSPFPSTQFPSQENIGDADLTEFNTFKIRWEADKIEWFLNDQLLSTQTGVTGLEDTEMDLHLNFWAPASGFGLAFSDSLQPTADESLNESFFFEADWVRVTEVPEPKYLSLLLAFSVASAAAYRRLKAKNRQN